MSNENLHELIKLKHFDSKSNASFKIEEKEEFQELFTNSSIENMKFKAHGQDIIKLNIKELNEKAKKMDFKISDLINVNHITKKTDMSQTLNLTLKGNFIFT